MQQAETSVDVVHPHWAHRAVATAERLAVHPAALQLRRLSEAPAEAVTGRIPAEAAHAWLEDSARWPQ